MDKKEIKELMFSLGADLCGVAGIDSFKDAPEGYHPRDVLPTCFGIKAADLLGVRFWR